MFERGLRYGGGGRLVGVKLDRNPTVITDRCQRSENPREIDHAFARREMLMHTILADVFQMHVRDFPRIFAALTAIGYDGWVTVELYPYEATAAAVAKAAFEHLRALKSFESLAADAPRPCTSSD